MGLSASWGAIGKAIAGTPAAEGLAGTAGTATGRTGAGSLRTEEATSGRGLHRATSSSTSRLLLPEAAARSASQLPSVRCGASSRTVVTFKEPSASLSSMTGNLRAARATSMRL
jgi:hypothetical protein